VKYLLVGLGNIGQKRRQLLGERCLATVDPFNAAADYRSPDDYPRDDYQAVILSVPNQAKLDLLEGFLRRGKHVLIEKPLLFADGGRAERLEQMARERGVVWYTSYNHRFEPLIGRLKDELDAGRLGELYHGRLFYGNGTVGNIVGTWRDQGLGVLEDLGSHLLDLTAFLLGRPDFRASTLSGHESAAFDHCVLTSAAPDLVLEATFLCWKNTFAIDLYGSRGSLHVHGLPKWGPSELVIRERVLPSGVPREERSEAPAGLDVTWQRDLEYFERLVTGGQTSLENDWWISRTLHSVAGA
jgi:scyllo-inositol 2-dehydrogenase (NADP+)